MSDDTPNEKPPHGSTPPRNPMFKSGETLPLRDVLDRLPLADANLLRDVDAALSGRDLGH